jgi:hypothetical protein
MILVTKKELLKISVSVTEKDANDQFFMLKIGVF